MAALAVVLHTVQVKVAMSPGQTGGGIVKDSLSEAGRVHACIYMYVYVLYYPWCESVDVSECMYVYMHKGA